MQAQIQALLVAIGGVGGAEREAMGFNMGLHIKVAEPVIFNRKAGKVGEFVITCRLYLRMKIKEATVIWKENIMEELEIGEMEYKTVEEFLTALKKEFGRGEKESVKVAELRKLEQGERTMEEFVQEFKRVARDNRYKGRSLVEEFKRGMNREIRRKLMKAENQLVSIKQ